MIASIIPLGAARSQADFTMDDMKAPRAMFERLPAWGQRASWAHQNSFEAFTLHAPAALLALMAVLELGELPGLAVPAHCCNPCCVSCICPPISPTFPPYVASVGREHCCAPAFFTAKDSRPYSSLKN